MTSSLHHRPTHKGKKISGKKKGYNKSNKTKFRIKVPAGTTATSNPHESRMNIKNVLGIAFLSVFFALVGASAEVFSYFIRKRERSAIYSWMAKNREVRERKTWAEEDARISDRMFYRLFRMTRPCFRKLCNKIEKAVGKEEFKSEKYIELELKAQGQSTKKGSMFAASQDTSGPYIPGEMKLALTLRILAGGSYLDMFLWLNVNADYVRFISKHVMRNWICLDEVVQINYFEKVLQDPHAMTSIRLTFARTSNGIINGIIGAVDGWLVRITGPTLEDTTNPGKYYSRKGFYAINVQAIVDKEKRILWRYIGEKGCSHDSPSFNDSNLGNYLSRVATSLMAKGIYIIGDSAYSLKSYLLTPYDDAAPGSHEDSFNYFLSKNRIYVECAFGEVDRRWGIFWRPLEGALDGHKYTIDAALRLHNFIVDYREEHGINTNAEKRRERDELNIACDNFVRRNPFEPIGVIEGDIEEQRGRGRPSNEEVQQRNNGRVLRDSLRDKLKQCGLSRRGKVGQRDRPPQQGS